MKEFKHTVTVRLGRGYVHLRKKIYRLLQLSKKREPSKKKCTCNLKQHSLYFLFSLWLVQYTCYERWQVDTFVTSIHFITALRNSSPTLSTCCPSARTTPHTLPPLMSYLISPSHSRHLVLFPGNYSQPLAQPPRTAPFLASLGALGPLTPPLSPHAVLQAFVHFDGPVLWAYPEQNSFSSQSWQPQGEMAKSSCNDHEAKVNLSTINSLLQPSCRLMKRKLINCYDEHLS